MTAPRFNDKSGIALGPILFILAILAILAAVIAAGSGGFSTNANSESAKAMAEVVIQSCHAYNDALQIMLHNGCDETKLDYTPNGGLWPTGTTAWQHGDFTGGNGTNQAGNGQCAFHDPRGGGMIYKPLPPAALMSTPTGAYTTNFGASAATMDAYAGFPLFLGNRCITTFGLCSQTASATGATFNAALILEYPYLNYAVCKQINTLLGINIDPNATENEFGPETQSIFANYNLESIGTSMRALKIFFYGGAGTASQYTEGCAYDAYANTATSSYLYSCALMIR